MNFLQICARLGVETGTAGQLTSVVNQTGEKARLVNWAGDAWRELQLEHRWDWMWEMVNITIPAAASSPVAANAIPWRRYKPEAYIGDRRCTGLAWDKFRRMYQVLNAGAVLHWTVRPDRLFMVNTLADVETVISAERWKNPTELVGPDDVPAGIPEYLHLAIVGAAMIKYAGYEEDAGSASVAIRTYFRLLATLTEESTPTWELGAPLA